MLLIRLACHSNLILEELHLCLPRCNLVSKRVGRCLRQWSLCLGVLLELFDELMLL